MPSAKRTRQRELQRSRQAAREAARRRQATRNRIVFAVVSVVVVLALFGLVFKGGGGSKSNASKTKSPTTTAGPATTAAGTTPASLIKVQGGASITGDTPCPKPDGSSPRTEHFAKPPPTCIDPAKTYKAVFLTSMGQIEVALDTKTTPMTVNNFVVLSRYHYYDGTGIFRTDPSIDIIQGGAPSESASDPGPGYTIKDEGHPPRHYSEGDLVMARTASPDSAGAQFFFVAGPKASGLDAQGTYVTFGKVTTGLDVVKKIIGLHVPYPPGSPQAGLGGGPSRPVVIGKINIVES